jgi:hypothetical protein
MENVGGKLYDPALFLRPWSRTEQLKPLNMGCMLDPRTSSGHLTISTILSAATHAPLAVHSNVLLIALAYSPHTNILKIGPILHNVVGCYTNRRMP